ncbi:hypothetical protein A2U01_0006831, partial [Trifolium medium]|nr:hypothetical protein [Trifolium medium]
EKILVAPAPFMTGRCNLSYAGPLRQGEDAVFDASSYGRVIFLGMPSPS